MARQPLNTFKRGLGRLPPAQVQTVQAVSWRTGQGSSSAARGYGYRWQRFRLDWLAKHPLCAFCALRGQVTAATVVDHVEPHRGDPVAFWAGPFQSLCASCHSQDKQRQEQAADGAGWAEHWRQLERFKGE